MLPGTPNDGVLLGPSIETLYRPARPKIIAGAFPPPFGERQRCTTLRRVGTSRSPAVSTDRTAWPKSRPATG